MKSRCCIVLLWASFALTVKWKMNKIRVTQHQHLGINNHTSSYKQPQKYCNGVSSNKCVQSYNPCLSRLLWFNNLQQACLPTFWRLTACFSSTLTISRKWQKRTKRADKQKRQSLKMTDTLTLHDDMYGSVEKREKKKIPPLADMTVSEPDRHIKSLHLLLSPEKMISQTSSISFVGNLWPCSIHVPNFQHVTLRGCSPDMAERRCSVCTPLAAHKLQWLSSVFMSLVNFWKLLLGRGHCFLTRWWTWIQSHNEQMLTHYDQGFYYQMNSSLNHELLCVQSSGANLEPREISSEGCWTENDKLWSLHNAFMCCC